MPSLKRSGNPGPPITLGNAALAHLRLIVWCRDCGHQVEPEPAEMARRHSPEVTVIVWSKRLICSRFSSRILFLMSRGLKAHEV
jgi:hypothetical protein